MLNKRLRLAVFIGLALLIAGCRGVVESTPPASSPAANQGGEQRSPLEATADDEPGDAVAVETGENEAAPAVETIPDTQSSLVQALPKPQNQLADREYGWQQLLGRDSIAPIYDPTFSSAEESPYAAEELVIGVEINGEAKAYAIGPLNGREMVNDTLGGVPILVTW